MKSERLKKENVLTVPNLLSMFRIALIPLILVLYCAMKKYKATVAVVALSGVTDVVDGKIARKFHMVSDVGKVLDPVADKLTEGALVICLILRYKWMWALLILMAIKEGLMLWWGYRALKKTDTMHSAKWYGKVSTVVLYSVMILLIFFPDIPAVLANALMLLCAVVMLVSLAGYGLYYRPILKGKTGGEGRTQDPGETKARLPDQMDSGATAVQIAAEVPVRAAGDAPAQIPNGAPAPEGIRKSRNWKTTAFQILMLLIWAAVILLCVFHRDELTVEGILRRTPGRAWLAALVMLALFALKSVSIVIYSGLLYAASGILFPLPAAIAVNLCGTVIMLTLPYFIGKKAGAPAVAYLREKHPKTRSLHQLEAGNDVLFAFLARIIRIPSDIVSLYMGAVGLDYRKYLLGSFLGMLPHTITYPIMGMSVSDIRSPEFLTALCAQIAYLALTAALYALYRRRHHHEAT